MSITRKEGNGGEYVLWHLNRIGNNEIYASGYPRFHRLFEAIPGLNEGEESRDNGLCQKRHSPVHEL